MWLWLFVQLFFSFTSSQCFLSSGLQDCFLKALFILLVKEPEPVFIFYFILLIFFWDISLLYLQVRVYLLMNSTAVKSRRILKPHP